MVRFCCLLNKILLRQLMSMILGVPAGIKISIKSLFLLLQIENIKLSSQRVFSTMFHTMSCSYYNCLAIHWFCIFCLLFKLYSAKVRIFVKVLVLPYLTDHNVFLFRLSKEIIFLNGTISIKRNWFTL